jgi:glycosyltransferase involved in cell wall biosynthesis
VPRILLCHQPSDGGVGRHVEDLAIGLRERDYEVALCGPSTPRGLAEDSTHIRLDLHRAVSPLPDLAAVARFGRIIHDLRPDVVHAHSSKAGAVARLAKLSHPRTPVVYTPHGYAFVGHFSRSIERISYRSVERALAPLASRVVCVCEAEARTARSIGPRHRVKVIYNGVEPVPSGPVDQRIAELARRGPVIGALTLLRPGKGLETLIDSLPAVLSRHPETQVAVVGEGPDLPALRARAQLRGVVHAVHFLGPSEEPLSVLRGFDVFVHPSWAEAFPYVILEAMSVDRPIVASDIGGIGEALIDGESGLLVPPQDDAALTRALLEMLDDPERRARIGALALSRVSRRFTRVTMIDRLAGLYDELVRLPLNRVPAADPRSEIAPPPPPLPRAAAGRGRSMR